MINKIVIKCTTLGKIHLKNKREMKRLIYLFGGLSTFNSNTQQF